MRVSFCTNRRGLWEPQVNAVRPAWRAPRRGYTLIEVVVSMALLGLLTLALFGALATGRSTVQASREELRATQILMQKMETIRLFTWDQSTNQLLASPTFSDWYDPLSTNGSRGVRYLGTVRVEPAPNSVPASLRPTVRLVTVTIAWTNHAGRRKGIAQQREMQTLIARHGLQNYVY